MRCFTDNNPIRNAPNQAFLLSNSTKQEQPTNKEESVSSGKKHKYVQAVLQYLEAIVWIYYL